MALGDLITGGVSSAVQGVAETVRKLSEGQARVAASEAARLAIKSVPEPQGERQLSGQRVLLVLALLGGGAYLAYRMGWLGKRKYRGRR